MIDFKKDPAYRAKSEPDTIYADPMLFIKIDGEGAPEDRAFQEAVQAIYGLVYSIKFWDKKHKAPKAYDKFSISPLETIWWMKGDSQFDMNRPKDWEWTALIRVPDFITQEFFEEVVEEVSSVKASGIYKKARLETMHEGLCVQIMHIGPYSSEKSSLDKMINYARNKGYEVYGRHHEIYFNDPRRTVPEKLKTILRYPIKKKDKEISLELNSKVA